MYFPVHHDHCLVCYFYESIFIWRTICVLIKCIYAAIFFLLGRSDTTSDEGTCWPWTKEWWRNGCQNLRYGFIPCAFVYLDVQDKNESAFVHDLYAVLCCFLLAIYFTRINKHTPRIALFTENYQLPLKHKHSPVLDWYQSCSLVRSNNN